MHFGGSLLCSCAWPAGVGQARPAWPGHHCAVCAARAAGAGGGGQKAGGSAQEAQGAAQGAAQKVGIRVGDLGSEPPGWILSMLGGWLNFGGVAI
eukprot:1158757-Pelagomonas_calceolata.AAC.6